MIDQRSYRCLVDFLVRVRLGEDSVKAEGVRRTLSRAVDARDWLVHMDGLPEVRTDSSIATGSGRACDVHNVHVVPQLLQVEHGPLAHANANGRTSMPCGPYVAFVIRLRCAAEPIGLAVIGYFLQKLHGIYSAEGPARRDSNVRPSAAWSLNAPVDQSSSRQRNAG